MEAASPSPRRDTSLAAMLDDATARLARMDLSCRSALATISTDTAMANVGMSEDSAAFLQLQIEQLKRELLDLIHRREDSDAIFQRAMQYAAAKGTANAVLHTLFDQASAGKYQVLEQWMDTGVIPTRDGLKHWRLDARELRNETGATLLHVAVDSSIARQNLKVKCVELLVDRMGFSVNIRDAFGRTPLHVAAMAGYAEVTQVLLMRGADATLRDRAGLTPLSVVRTLSKPPEEVVQLLAAAESEATRQRVATSNRVPPATALASAMFLRTVSQFVRPSFKSALTSQANKLLEVVLMHKQEAAVAFDDLLWDHVPLLFETAKHASEDVHETRSLARLDDLFQSDMYSDARFVDDLKIEAFAYDHSLVTSTGMSTRAGATWEGLVLKLIQGVRAAMATQTIQLQQGLVAKDDATVSDTQGSEHALSSNPASPHGRSPMYADRVTATNTRQAWHYAVLFKASTQPFPGFLSTKKGESTATCSEDVGRFFPLHDRLIIDSAEYHCISYDAESHVIQLDREYEGPNAAEIKAYLAGACSPLVPPYIATKRIWEREPGNKYEDHLSNEQDLFQDYQFLDPDSEYEVAVKLGPVSTAREAKAIVEEWKAQVRRLFDEKKCTSGLASCNHYCPQRHGHSLCVETMAAVGREIAKERLGRPTYSKQLKPRASLQKYQDLYLGKAPWPGSPSTAAPHSFGDAKAAVSPDFT